MWKEKNDKSDRKVEIWVSVFSLLPHFRLSFVAVRPQESSVVCVSLALAQLMVADRGMLDYTGIPRRLGSLLSAVLAKFC